MAHDCASTGMRRPQPGDTVSPARTVR